MSRTVGALVGEVAARLATRFGTDARAEARDLVAAVAGEPRFWPSLAAAREVPQELASAVAEAAARRAAGAPLAYAVRSAPFRALTLAVDERVLIPRPETEYLVDVLLRTSGVGEGIAVDVGTGSGALALALAAEGRFARVIGTDVSCDALTVAAANEAACRARLQAPVEWRAGDALAPVADLTGGVDLLVSNPPYIAFGEVQDLPAAVRDWEPPQALSCADEGLAVTRRVVAGAGALVRPGGTLALEVDARRARRVAELVQGTGCFAAPRIVPDLTGRDRFVLATRRPLGDDAVAARHA